MSATFYNNLGGMVGVDPHTYIAFPDIEIKWIYPHIVVANFSGLLCTWYKRTEKSTSDGVPMLRGGFDLYLVPHICAPILPPGVEECKQWLKVVIMAGSKAQLTAHSVTGEGEALATCVSGCIGLNVNCAEPFDLPIGIVINPSSVMTSPTSGDYCGAVAGWALDAFINVIMSSGLDAMQWKFAPQAVVKHIWRRLPDLLKGLGLDTVSKWADISGRLAELVQQEIDD